MFNTEVCEKEVTYSEIRKYYEQGAKVDGDVKIGLEYERLPIYTNTGFNAGYFDEFGVSNLLRKIANNENWDFIMDDFSVIGLRNDEKTITLEPGCQFEYSISPKKSLDELKTSIIKTDKEIESALKESGITLLNYGVSPIVTYKSINLIPKRRYKVMAKYLWGILSDVMMRETAGFQVAIDYKSEEDASRKFVLANKIMPFMTAMFANSPIRGGVETGYKSFRSLSWLNTDNDRCGFALNLDEEFSFDTYISKVLKTPMIFVNKQDLPLETNGRLNFAQYMSHGFEGFKATMEDFLLSANLCFPEVRLNNFIEIRNHDCVGRDLVMAGVAMYKGLLYDDISMDEAEELLKEFKHLDYSELRYEVPRFALHSRIKGKKCADISRELIAIAEKSLKKSKDAKYLSPLKCLTCKGLTPADKILKNWHGSWNKDVKKLIKYLVKQS